jgi:hypothetical protein
MSTPVAVFAWNNCPYGVIDDPFPGQCPRYIDTNNNGFCDLSESPTSANITNNSSNQNQQNTSVDIKQPNKITNEYYLLIPISVTVTILYLFTYLLFVEKKLKRRMFYRIWNYILTLSFLITGVTGLLLILLINYGIHTSWNVSIDFWHAEFAIVVAITTIFHIHLYWKQFKKIFVN